MPDPLDLLAARVAAEHQLLLHRAQSLDGSIGVTLGFASALAALADLGDSGPARIAVVLAVLSALTSMAALSLQSLLVMQFDLPDDLLDPATDLRRMFADFDLRRNARTERRMERKHRLFRLATGLLVAAVVVGSGGIVL